MERRLSVIMFTDMVGYTRMAQANESLALEVLEEHKALIRPLIASHGGTEVKTIGDAFLVEFRSALDAVMCGVKMQHEIAERNSSLPDSRRALIRVGIHLGDVVHSKGDVYGDAVNVASRIEPLAEPGGVCISRQVYDNVRNKTDLEIVRMGEVELKNVELPMEVYKISMEASRGARGGGNAPRERLAVLPFVNISPDPNDEYFADGLTEELITKLSEVKGLKVIARTSVMNYKKKEKSVSQIGRELGAGSIIEGSVRKAGNKIRVSVQLIDSGTEEHLWASNYDKDLGDIFAIQSDVASRVAGSVSAGFFPATPKGDTSNVEAYTMYVKAVQLSHEGRGESLRESVSLLGKAIARDPAFARAHAALSIAWQQLAVRGFEDFGVIELRGEPAARKALEYGPGSAEAHAAMAGIDSALDRFDDMVFHAREALRINPNLAEAHYLLGINHATMGRLQEGLASLERAYELDPLQFHVVATLALVARVAGKGARAAEVLERLNQIDPDNIRILAEIAQNLMFEEDFGGAQKVLDQAFKLSPTDGLLHFQQGMLYALTGRREKAAEILKLVEEERAESVRLYSQLFVHAALGDLDEAFKALDRQEELHSWPFLVGSLPVFAELRKDPRYLEFCRKIGLPT